MTLPEAMAAVAKLLAVVSILLGMLAIGLTVVFLKATKTMQQGPAEKQTPKEPGVGETQGT